MLQIGSDLLTVSEDLVKLLEQSAATLATVAHRLDEEFANRFTGSQVHMLLCACCMERLRSHDSNLSDACSRTLRGSLPE